MEQLVKKLKEKNLTIASCESLTGGMFASSIVNVSGASSVFAGSYVTYMDKAKEILLDGKEILDKYGAVSYQMAYLMAKTVKEKFAVNIGVSFTGNAGPTGSENKPVGLVYRCIVFNEKKYEFEDHYNGSREDIRKQCIIDAKNRILQIIEEKH